MMPRRNSWLPYPARDNGVALRLFCFPHAGGGASAFREWTKSMTGEVEACPVQPPGREDRIQEPFCTDIAMLMADLADALLPRLDVPFALVGNSVGAIVAFELARYLQDMRGLLPERLIVAGSAAPHRLPADLPKVEELSDAELAESLAAKYGGIPAPLLRFPELLAIFIPVMRADLAMLQNYRAPDLPALACPVTALVGEEDPLLPELVAEWRAVTTAAFDHVTVPGGHFALFDNGDRVTAMLKASRALSRFAGLPS